MKATGIVRRIDDLGRVVIPKEIRKTQSIRQGDPLEIFITDAGEVLFKKHSTLNTFFDFTARYVNVLAKELGRTVLVCDSDIVIAVSGANKKDFSEMHIGNPLKQVINKRQYYSYNANDTLLYPCENAKQFLLLAHPILANGDVIGAIALLGETKGIVATEAEQTALSIASSFFSKEFEA